MDIAPIKHVVAHLDRELLQLAYRIAHTADAYERENLEFRHTFLLGKRNDLWEIYVELKPYEADGTHESDLLSQFGPAGRY